MSLTDHPLSREEILGWLREEDPRRLEELWAAADQVRREGVGDEVHLRGLIELSNICRRQCAYCGLRAGNVRLERYRMRLPEVLAAAIKARDLGYGTVVVQAGEDPGLDAETVGQLVRSVKRDTGLAVTLSLGERTDSELALWRAAGADRYLLRFETSDQELYARIHPALNEGVSRIAQLRALRRLGYEIGSGVMVGIPGQSWASLADDVMLFRELDLDMIGVGPFIAHPDTPLGTQPQPLPQGEQVTGGEVVVYRLLALARLACPQANIPSTTALATLNRKNGRELGLTRGANVVMPNVTPLRYRAKYEIYPGKACINETAEACQGCLEGRIRALGRRIGKGAGGRRGIG